jgi:hypothetical protein
MLSGDAIWMEDSSLQEMKASKQEEALLLDLA